MTLIAFSTSKNRADIISDTFAYSHWARRTARDSKVHPIAHLDMAYATQGHSGFGALWTQQAKVTAMFADTFDDFAKEATPHIREVWESVDRLPGDEATVFLIGYSPEAGRFKACLFDAASDFECQDIEAPFIMPAPFDTPLSELELARLKDHFADNPDAATMMPFLEEWHQKPELPAPTTVKGWVQLGKQARESRALVSADTGVKVLIAGDLHHSVLKRGGFQTARVHSFNDSGAEFALLLAGTYHPAGQYGPCAYCDSGRPAVDCCLAADATCSCGSGKPFQACCSVRAGATHR